jgi:hypothetical protein
MAFRFNTHEKAPVPESLAAQEPRAEITGKNPPRWVSNTTVCPSVATRPRIIGTLHLWVSK